ncbi:MAG: hypothetical protein WBA23_20620 [Tunicatimonas sp.]|uniref:hypothetical protein n=1 Tax=Tunicatimonas sp. TaxID=1940096 RepID=UPI003C715ECA
MKTIVVLITLLWGSSLAYAQEYRAAMSANTIRLVLHNTEVSIEGHDGNELIINASGYEAPPNERMGFVRYTVVALTTLVLAYQ